MTFPQKIKYLVLSNAFPGPISGPHLSGHQIVYRQLQHQRQPRCEFALLELTTHQSSTSALPVKAWQIIMTLSLAMLSFPQVLYATGTSRSVRPDSSVNDGIRAIVCPLTISEKPEVIHQEPSCYVVQTSISSERGQSRSRQLSNLTRERFRASVRIERLAEFISLTTAFHKG